MVETKYKKMLTGGRHTNDKQLFRHTCIIPTMLKTAVRLTCKKIATVPFCKPDMFIGTMGTLRSSGFAVAKLPFSLRIDAILKSLPSRLLRFWSLNDFKPSKVYPAASSSFPWLTHKTVRGRRRRHVVGAEVLSSGSRCALLCSLAAMYCTVGKHFWVGMGWTDIDGEHRAFSQV